MFKVGDRVTGIGKEYYGYTTEDATMKVLHIDGGEIVVEVLSHKDPLKQLCVGMRYKVSGRHFRPVKTAFKGNS